MANYVDYTNPATAQEQWLAEIAPKYFNFNAAVLHRTGIFGYTNEVMATVENDTAHAVSIARREFYPTTAAYTSSMFKMAALQQIPYPFAHAAEATAILMIREKDIIDHGEFTNGQYRFVLDSSTVISADGKEFLLDYPIIIIAKDITKNKNGSGIIGNVHNVDGDVTRYAYTARYDIKYTNDLSIPSNAYIQARVVKYNVEAYLLLKVSLHQCSTVVEEWNINSSPVLNNIAQDFHIDGKLCNFEVFYSESNDDAVYQLKKLPLNSKAINGKFCMYSLVDPTTLRISFPENPYFAPKFNSVVKVVIYTTLGSEGNFPEYKGNLVCTLNSEDYPYNNMCTITGLIQGSAKGGSDLDSEEDFRQDVIAAYATNKTITTERDLQVYFDSVMTDERTKVIFHKKRDDSFERMYGAFLILKDVLGNIVPTNTLTLEIKESQVDVLFEHYGKAVVKPGKVWKYQNEEHLYSNYGNLYCTDANLNTDINDNVSDFCYTNIFLMQIMKSPNMVGYYLNTVNDTIMLDMTDVNDKSYLQFNISSFNIKRNAIRGENFYKLSVSLVPSIVKSELYKSAFLTAEEMTELDHHPLEIKAEHAGIVEAFKYLDHPGKDSGGSVFMVVRYFPEDPNIKRGDLVHYVTEDGMPTIANDPDDLTVWIRIASSVQYTTNDSGNKVYDTSAYYTTDLEVGDTFTAESIIARRKLKDNGIIRVIAELSGETFGLYIPMLLDDYDESKDLFTFTAYLSTDDVMNDEGRLEIIGGFCNMDGTYRDFVSLDPNNCQLVISSFVQYDDVNYEHAYSGYDYLRWHTHTNTFVTSSDKVNFVLPITFIRSTITYNQLIANDSEDQEFPEILFKITEIPVIRSNWIKNVGNVFDLIAIIRRDYDHLQEAYKILENNYSIDMKFFNTYGKSKFFRIGIMDDMETLYKVNIVLRFGIKISMLSPFEEFKPRFISFVREYIESFNDVTNRGNSIYIMDLITDIKNKFTEIERLEFYGVDNYSVAAAQNIESFSEEEIRQLGYNQYVPEFVNVYCDYNNNVLEPKIEITMLE